MNYPSPLATGNAARERDPNCIENTLKQIEVELSESLNSAENLADKLRCENGGKELAPGTPEPGSPDIVYRLNRIANRVRELNQQLGRAHSAISG